MTQCCTAGTGLMVVSFAHLVIRIRRSRHAGFLHIATLHACTQRCKRMRCADASSTRTCFAASLVLFQCRERRYLHVVWCEAAVPTDCGCGRRTQRGRVIVSSGVFSYKFLSVSSTATPMFSLISGLQSISCLRPFNTQQYVRMG